MSVSIPNPIAVGTPVEILLGGVWKPGTVARFDIDDDNLPYYCEWPGHSDWKSAADVRLIGADVPKLQHRFRMAARWTEWADFELGQTLAFSHSHNAMQVRQKPTRTDAEILAKLREIDHTTLTAARLHEILGGTF